MYSRFRIRSIFWPDFSECGRVHDHPPRIRMMKTLFTAITTVYHIHVGAHCTLIDNLAIHHCVRSVALAILIHYLKFVVNDITVYFSIKPGNFSKRFIFLPVSSSIRTIIIGVGRLRLPITIRITGPLTGQGITLHTIFGHFIAI